MKKSIRIVVGMLIFLFWIIQLWSEDETTEDELTADVNLCDEFVYDTLANSSPARLIQRSWSDYENDSYCTSFFPEEEAKLAAEKFRNLLNLHWDGDYHLFWHTLYKRVVEQDAGKLDYLRDSLMAVAADRNLSREELANLTVSFVQDIPYEYVMPEPCKGNETKPCNGNVEYGLFAPSEFIWQLKGDCDTRTLLLYLLLENMGFNAVVLISHEYAHAMLGVDIPASGDYIRHKGINFYFWETTALGWMLGTVPPDMQQLSYWKIALD